MSQKSNRGKRRGPVRDGARPASPAAAADRYQKFLPEWMRGNHTAALPRPPRPRRTRPARPAGGYTPGKFAVGD
ncbi:MAG: hypothetical protein KGK07_11185 [Chloroflexota bacterium]|nr:hypothetical protein [Chloroflexota bacterium]